ncbi:MAG: hypothetical protein IK066_12785, partial [Kiritimatiellae bacterium]|nr:hypothetical protein [Kiritimatiellia bacterium]
MLREEKAARQVENTARRKGEYVARFSRLEPDTQNILLGALDRIRSAGGSPEDVRAAVEAFAEGLGGGKCVGEALAGHLEGVKGKRAECTFRDRMQRLKSFGTQFGEVPLGRLSRGGCKKWIDGGHTASEREHRHKALSAFLRDCVAREWLRENPMSGLKRERCRGREDVRIFSAEEAERLLRAAERVSPGLVPYYALGLFAGLRPQKELAGLEEKAVDVEGGMVWVPGWRVKTRVAREVPVSKNLGAWLRAHPVEGRVRWSRGEHLRVVKEAKVAWSPDVMRHTRASFRLAQTRDPARVADEMGHDAATLKRHYANRRIAPGEVERFWGILPAGKG